MQNLVYKHNYWVTCIRRQPSDPCSGLWYFLLFLIADANSVNTKSHMHASSLCIVLFSCGQLFPFLQEINLSQSFRSALSFKLLGFSQWLWMSCYPKNSEPWLLNRNTKYLLLAEFVPNTNKCEINIFIREKTGNCLQIV